jgi:hypothetical protein
MFSLLGLLMKTCQVRTFLSNENSPDVKAPMTQRPSTQVNSLICSQSLKSLSTSLPLQPPWALASDVQFHDHFTDGRTPWTSDQLVARPLPKHRTTQTQNKHTHIPNIHALYGIRTHNPGFRANENSICLRPLGYHDRQSRIPDNTKYQMKKYQINCLISCLNLSEKKR